jgi:50S ribosomal protein L4
MKVDVKNTAGKSVGQIELADEVFAAEVHEHLLWEVVKWQLAKRRAGNASTKRIGEIRGSSIKAWKQKGTGRARQGSRKGPHWVGGGSVFGPKPRSYEYTMPRKAKKAALRSALSLRAGEQKIIVVDKFESDGKTKGIATALAALEGPHRRREGQREPRPRLEEPRRLEVDRARGPERLRHPPPRDRGDHPGLDQVGRGRSVRHRWPRQRDRRRVGLGRVS